MYHFSIGTSIDRIDLLDPHGFHAGDWEPTAGDTEESVADSPLSDYERLQYYREICVDEEMDLTVSASNQDGLIRKTQNLRRMLRLAMDYWVEKWRSYPVYLAAQASCETNRRYAIVHRGKVPNDLSPYLQPFLQEGKAALMVIPFVVRRGPWCETAPGVATCIEACNPEDYTCWPYYLQFVLGNDDYVNGHSDVALDDLPPTGLTVEAWIRPDSWGQSNQGWIICKSNNTRTNGWTFYLDSTRGLCGYVNYDIQDAWSASGIDEFSIDGEWHHVAMTFHPTGYEHNGYIRLWIDGTEVSSYFVQNQAQGVYIADAAEDVIVGNGDTQGADYDGDIGWVRVSDYPIYSSDFTPIPRCYIPPVIDPTGTYLVVGLWIYEGTGITTGNRADSGGTVGDIVGATWAECDCDKEFGRLCGDTDLCWPGYLHYNGVEGAVGSGDAGVANMPDDNLDFTCEAWVRADGWGEGGGGAADDSYIFNKENIPGLTTGWYLGIDAGLGLDFWVNGGPGIDGYAASGVDEFSPDGEWHHVVGCMENLPANPTNARLWLAIDGVWVASYSFRQDRDEVMGAGTYGNDAADTLYIGNRGDGVCTWDGDIGWVRFSDNIRYTLGVNFTPPARCIPPDGDANTYAIWIWEGGGLLTYDRSGNCRPAYLSPYVTWDCDCDYTVDETTSCDDPPYIINCLKTAGLTDIYHYYNTAGGGGLDFWSPNLLTQPLPYNLLPTVLNAAVLSNFGPAVYFGVAEDLIDGGPFNNLVFNLETAQTGLTGHWEFWDNAGPGAWRTFIAENVGPQDNTNQDGLMTGETFDTTGIKSVHWRPAGDWSIPGPDFLDVACPGTGAPPIYAWWVRWIVTAVPGVNGTPPVQQTRHPYTICWPYVEIEDEDVPGDIAASLALALFNESDHNGGIYEPLTHTSRVICGLRSQARGEDFVAFLNASDEQNPPFITFTPSGAWVVNDYILGPTGKQCFRNLPAATTEDAGEWTIEDGYTNQFYGIYRAFCRVTGAGSAAGDLSIQFRLNYGEGRGATVVKDFVDTRYTGANIQLIDFGKVVIPPLDTLKLEEDAELGITIRVRNNAAGIRTVQLWDLILIPTDEWAGEFEGLPDPWSDYLSGNRSMAVDAWGGKGRYLLVDSITNPRFDLRALSLIRDTGNFAGLSDIIANRPARLHENATQRLWFLVERCYDSGTDRSSDFWIAHSVQLYRQANYLSMRGDR